MLLRNLGSDDGSGDLAKQLSGGIPTIAGFAMLCGRFIAGQVQPPKEISDEAKAILAVAAERGMLEIRVSREAFDSLERLTAVCVEVDEDRRLLFKQKSNPKQTLRFLEGFRELCQSGCVMHHSHVDFSLTVAGFELAESLDRNEFQSLIDFAQEVEF